MQASNMQQGRRVLHFKHFYGLLFQSKVGIFNGKLEIGFLGKLILDQRLELSRFSGEGSRRYDSNRIKWSRGSSSKKFIQCIFCPGPVI